MCAPSSATLIYSDSFESYTVGSAPGAPWNPPYAHATVVTNSYFHTGAQSVNLDGSSTTSGVIGQDTAYYSDGIVQYSFMEPSSTSADFQTYVTNGASEVYVSMDINFSTGKILWKTAASGYLSTNLAGTTSALPKNVWHTVQIAYNVATATANVSFDGTQTGTNLPLYATTMTDGSATRVYIADNRTASTANANPVMLDDWSFNSVPEPATMSLLGIGIAILVRRGRK
jgi:hypothetical protein